MPFEYLLLNGFFCCFEGGCLFRFWGEELTANVKEVCTVFEIIHGRLVLKDPSALGLLIIPARFSTKKIKPS